jgi:hypothetical protein
VLTVEVVDGPVDSIRSAAERASALKTSAFWVRVDAGLLRLEAQRLRDEAFIIRAETQLRSRD